MTHTSFHLILSCLLFVTLIGAAPAQPSFEAPSGTSNGRPSSLPAEEDILGATQETFRAVAEDLHPSLVRIETVGGAQPPAYVLMPDDDEQPEQRRRTQNPFRDTPGSSFMLADGPTTGIVYSTDGYIVSSSFNFVREPLLITATLWDGRRFAARLVARDQVRKIALLKIDVEGLQVPAWCDRTEVHVGQWAIALGLGFGGDYPSVTAGVISALDRMHGNAVQTDAKLSPANYGGPLCDIRGRVIGMAVPMAQRPGELAGIEFYDSGIGFVVPKDRLDEIVDVLRTGTSFYRGWLGIQIDPRVPHGVVIARLADPSPMLAAGVMPGDRIVEANGNPIHNFGDLIQTLYMLPAGETVDLFMARDGSSYAIDVALARSSELGPLPDAEEPPVPFEPAPSDEDE